MTESKSLLQHFKKFPVIYKDVESTQGKRFAVIVDEAHSSQTGTAAPVEGADEATLKQGGTPKLADGTVITQWVTDDTLPGGPRTVERTYTAPFARANREEDYQVAWAFLRTTHENHELDNALSPTSAIRSPQACCARFDFWRNATAPAITTIPVTPRRRRLGFRFRATAMQKSGHA